jgi:paraquat-inducible protein B
MRKYNAPRVKKSRGVQLFTTIWLVPLIALVIALWLAFQYYTKIGAMVEIRFNSNAGLIANQSPIKMRNVPVGIVKNITLTEDGEGVIVQARINREINPYLNDKAKFWIVHPNVGSNGVYGLDTIVSGSYISLHGEKGGEQKYQFDGLDKPYVDEAKGTYYILSAPESYNISEGSKLYYRMINIGRVVRVGISPDGSHVNFAVFVEEQYTPYINKKSKFYTRSAINLDLTKRGLDMSIAPLSQLLHGGISIYTPTNTLDKNYSIEEDTIFPLYKNIAEMRSKQFGLGGESQIYRATFQEPTTKLQIGSAVEFQGFQVGYITEIENHYLKEEQRIQSHIYLLLYLDAFSQTDQEKEKIIQKLVQRGLKAKLSSSLPIVGSQYIELVFDPKNPSTIINRGEYQEFPTLTNNPQEDIITQLKSLVNKLQNLPLEKLLNSLNGLVNENRKPIKKLINTAERTINNLNKSINNINHLTANKELNEIPQNLNRSLLEMETTLKELQTLAHEYGADSKFADQISVTLKAVTEASRSFDKTNKMLDRNPNALVVGDE